MSPIELLQKTFKNIRKSYYNQNPQNLRRLHGSKIIEVVKVHKKIRIKSVSVANLFSSTKHSENGVLHYSTDGLAALLRKTCAKCNLTTNNITSIENTQENMCRTQFVIKPPPTTLQLFQSKYSLRRHMQTATQRCPN